MVCGSRARPLSRLHGLSCRALGRLAVTVEEVERVLGLPAIAFDEEDGESLSAIDTRRRDVHELVTTRPGTKSKRKSGVTESGGILPG